ncbi:hypothetical protein [Actinomycetospora sp. TBRC 11914]|uniref:hypothetical protein n=1 Tax=Actinomycetospora sp. TBRC 11914 TaxID=2729387 RepID=UPI00145FD199|nr:hypothetical protein [Actinomycetospora sp. TBRC 11914]NMO92980.1 hypothetical protein [Actinomycetospora sp. TBRC 11914]
MTRIGTALRSWWDEQQHVWDTFLRLQRPWEQEGPLRWEQRLGNGWELHGSTLPVDEPAAGPR